MFSTLIMKAKGRKEVKKSCSWREQIRGEHNPPDQTHDWKGKPHEIGLYSVWTVRFSGEANPEISLWNWRQCEVFDLTCDESMAQMQTVKGIEYPHSAASVAMANAPCNWLSLRYLSDKQRAKYHRGFNAPIRSDELDLTIPDRMSFKTWARCPDTGGFAYAPFV